MEKIIFSRSISKFNNQYIKPSSNWVGDLVCINSSIAQIVLTLMFISLAISLLNIAFKQIKSMFWHLSRFKLWFILF